MSSNASKPMGIRRVQIARESDMPGDIAATPGGTMFGTTPGGTKIIYDRLYLLKVRDSPASHTPPTRLPAIPGVTCPKEPRTPKTEESGDGDAKPMVAEPVVADPVDSTPPADDLAELEL